MANEPGVADDLGLAVKRAPMPRPRQVEIDTVYRLLQNAGIPVIDLKETRLAT